MATNGLQMARGAAMARTAETMLRAVGGGEVRLLMPAPMLADATARQLGLEATTLEEEKCAPVVVRRVTDRENSYELVFAATTVSAAAGARQLSSAEELFATARGVMVDDKQLRIEAVHAEFFAGAPYMYRVIAGE